MTGEGGDWHASFDQWTHELDDGRDPSYTGPAGCIALAAIMGLVWGLIIGLGLWLATR